jgi:hypothetical protein
VSAVKFIRFKVCDFVYHQLPRECWMHDVDRLMHITCRPGKGRGESAEKVAAAKKAAREIKASEESKLLGAPSLTMDSRMISKFDGEHFVIQQRDPRTGIKTARRSKVCEPEDVSYVTRL